MLSFHCFETALGTCAVAWNGDSLIVGSQLPEHDAAATRRRMQARFPTAIEAALSPASQAAVLGVQRLLAGEAKDTAELLAVSLDDSALPAFHARVLALTRRIPVGQTLTYGEIASQLGEPGAARAVGQAEGSNPFAPIVPCHRVIGKGRGAGGVGTGFSAHGGVATKLRLLVIEARAVGQMVGDQTGLFG